MSLSEITKIVIEGAKKNGSYYATYPSKGKRMKTVIEMAREAGMVLIDDQYSLLPFLERFAELVRADERERFCTVLRQLHDSYSLSSDPSGFKARGNT